MNYWKFEEFNWEVKHFEYNWLFKSKIGLNSFNSNRVGLKELVKENSKESGGKEQENGEKQEITEVEGMHRCPVHNRKSS